MDSVGSGEILVIALVALLAIDPRTAGKWWGRLRRLGADLARARALIEREMLLGEQEDPGPAETPQQRLRKWARRRVDELGQTEFDQAGVRLVELLRAWEPYREADEVAAFWSIGREIPLHEVLEAVLADGKRLWLPRVLPEPGRMEMVPVADLDGGVVPGKWGIREPSGDSLPVPARILVLVPGEVFDLHGGRIGKGGGYYDRWLAAHPDATRVGIAWDRQVHPGNLPQSTTDRPMDHLLTPERFVHFPSKTENGKGGDAPGETAEEPNA